MSFWQASLEKVSCRLGGGTLEALALMSGSEQSTGRISFMVEPLLEWLESEKSVSLTPILPTLKDTCIFEGQSLSIGNWKIAQDVLCIALFLTQTQVLAYSGIEFKQCELLYTKGTFSGRCGI